MKQALAFLTLLERIAMHFLILFVVIGLIVAVTVLPADKEREIK